jgi:starch synthase
MAVRIGYEEPLAHRLHAGADVLLHPSRFEPCGLTQIYAMRYGTIPVVRSIGGLADTVTDATAHAIRAGTATGFAFAGTSAADLIACIDRCLSLFRQPLAWRKIQRRAMEHDFGWENSARMYLELYRELAPQAAAATDPRADEDRQASTVPKVIVARR